MIEVTTAEERSAGEKMQDDIQKWIDAEIPVVTFAGLDPEMTDKGAVPRKANSKVQEAIMNVRGYTELSGEAMMRAEVGECPFCGNTEVGKNGCTDEARWCYKCRASWLLCYKFVGVKVTHAPEKKA